MARDKDVVPSAGETVESFATLRAVVNAVMDLPEPYRTALLLRYWEDLTPQEVAQRTGVPLETARTHIKRGVDRLRAQLDRQAGSRSAWVVPLLHIDAVWEPLLSGSAAAGATASAASLIGVLAMKKTALATAAVALVVATVAMFTLGNDGARAGDATGSEGGMVSRTDPPPGRPEPRQPATGDLRMELPADTPLGRVVVRVRYHDGSPAPDIGLYLRHHKSRELGTEQRTDVDGMATFPGLATGDHHVLLDRGGAQAVHVTAGKRSDCEFEIAKGVTVRGRVITLAGQPVAGAKVYALREAHHDLMVFLAQTDGAGTFELRDVAPGLRLFARADGWQPTGPRHGRPVRGQPGETVKVEIKLGARGYGLQGQVLDAKGQPAPHAWVAIAVDEDCSKQIDGLKKVRAGDGNGMLDREAFFARADAEGRFSTTEVPWGDVALLARGAGLQDHLVGGARVRVDKGTTSQVVVHLRPGAVIFGTVRDEEGRPYAGIALHAEFRGTVELGELERGFGHYLADRTCVTDADGNYRLDGLFEAEQGISWLLPTGKQQMRKVEVHAGQEVRLDLTVSRTWQLRVRVQDKDGSPLEGWAVMLSRGGPIPYRLVDKSRTGTDGVHTATGLLGEGYVLSVHAPEPEGDRPVRRFPSFLRKVTRGDEEVVAVVSARMGKIRGRLLDSTGAPVARARLKHRLVGFEEEERAHSGSDGRFSIERLPAGEYEFDMHRNSPHLTLKIRLAAGEEKDLGDLFLPALAPMIVELRAKDGKPIKDARLSLLSRQPHPETGQVAWRMDASGRARDGTWRCDNMAEGEYLLQVSGRDIAALARKIQLTAGAPAVLRIDCARGVEQSFQIDLLPDSRYRHAVLKVHDLDGNEILSKWRFDLRDPRNPTTRMTVRMSPGKYSATVEGHPMVEGMATGRATARIEVPKGGGSPVRILLR